MKQWVWSAEHSARTWVIAWETILPPFLQDRCHPLSPTSSCWQEPALVSMHWLLLLPPAAPGRALAGAEGLPGDPGMQLPCRGDGADAGLCGDLRSELDFRAVSSLLCRPEWCPLSPLVAWGGGRAPAESPEALRGPEGWWEVEEGRQGRGNTDHTVFPVPAPFPSTPTPPPNTIFGLIFSIAARTLVTPCHPPTRQEAAVLVPSSHQLRGGIQARPGHPLTLLLGMHTASQEPPSSAWVRGTAVAANTSCMGGGGRTGRRQEGNLFREEKAREALAAPHPQEGARVCPGSWSPGSLGPGALGTKV